MSGNGLMTVGELSRRTGTSVKAGASMLLAAGRGYAGCEVVAVPNWRLRRDDQVGCVLFAPVDAIERGRRDSQESRRPRVPLNR